MTKFELAEMMGLRYSRGDKKPNHEWPVYIFYVDVNCREKEICIYAYVDEHDLEWAKNKAAEEFFEQILVRTFS